MPEQIDRYKVVIWWSADDGRFLAKMPELNGAVGDGPTQAEARAMVCEVGEIWLGICLEEGRPIAEAEAIAA